MSERIEMLFKAAGLLAAIGYVSFRAHANYLGLWPHADPSYTFCLMEGYPLLTSLVWLGFGSAFWSVLFILGLFYVNYRAEKNPARWCDWQLWVARKARDYSPPAVLLSLFLLLCLTEAFATGKWNSDDIMMGKLDPTLLAYRAEKVCSISFEDFAPAAILGWICLWIISKYPNMFRVCSYSIKPLYMGLLVAQALFLAILYGQQEVGCNFSVADMEHGGSKQEVVLIDIGDAGVSVWNVDTKNPDEPTGQITIYPKDQVLLHIKKTEDIREYALALIKK